MIAAAETAAIRRILVAQDASAANLAVLEAAADLAARLHAELAGLFVEDEDLLKLAGLPFARAFSAEAADMPKLDTAAMERALRVQAGRAREALAAAAARHRVDWSFQVTRGATVTALVAAARQCDVLGLGKAGGVHTRLGSTTRATLASASCGILLLHSRASLGRGVVALYAGNPRPLQTGAALARDLGLALRIAVADGAAAAGLAEEAAAIVRQAGVTARVDRLAPAGPAGLAAAIDALRGGLVVAAAAGPLADARDLETFVETLAAPLLMVR